MSTEYCTERRKKFLDQLEDTCFGFVTCGNEVPSTNDETYMFEPNRNYVYLTGDDAPKSFYFFTKAKGKVTEYIFAYIPTEREVRYSGVPFDKEGLINKTGIENVRPLGDFEDVISRFLFSTDAQVCYVDIHRWRMSYAPEAAHELIERIHKGYPYMQFKNAFHIIAALRTVKYPDEIEEHRKACEITNQAVRNMLRNMKPGMKECEIEAYYDFVLKSNEVKVPAFTTIAATGINACHMHYVQNNTPTKDGDLILFDLGAQSNYYCADVSRTYPVNGKFTQRQKQLYSIVLKGLQVAEDYSKPGQKKDELQLLSKKVMAEELIKIGKISKPEEIGKYYFHGSGHLIGLDTHDVGDNDLTLCENMMFTLEPGLYFDDEETGIRIEDTLLVTKDGCDVFTSVIPKEIEDIENYMAKYNR